MNYGSPWSEAFIKDLDDREFRDEFVADQIRARIALLIRALREQGDRRWSQSELGRQMGGKPQSVISRLEDPDYGKLSVQTLLETAAAFGLPLWIDMPEWEEWLGLIRDVPSSKTKRRTFNADRLKAMAHPAVTGSAASSVIEITSFLQRKNVYGQLPNQAPVADSTSNGSVEGFPRPTLSVSVA